MSVAAVVVAAGSGARFGGEAKQFRRLGGAPLLAWSCTAFAMHPDIAELVAVVPAPTAARPPAWLSTVADRVTAGGETRQDSVARGLAALDNTCESVLIHDGARPFPSPALISRVLAASATGPAVPGLPLTDTVKLVDDKGRVLSTVDRNMLRTVQTPQAFPRRLITAVHERAAAEGVQSTDDAGLVEREGIPVRLVAGEELNLKITTPFDFAVADWLIARGDVEAAGVRRPSEIPD